MKKLLTVLSVLFLVAGAQAKTCDKQVFSGLGTAGAINQTITPYSDSCMLSEIRLTLSAAATTSEDVVFKLDSLNGAGYDHYFLKEDATVSTDGMIRYKANPPDILAYNGDKIVVTFTNTDDLDWSLEVIFIIE